MAIRTGAAATKWARSRIGIATAPTSSGTWFRWCKVFVRLCFNVPSDGTPDAGKAWDRAKHKHPETNPLKIPAAVPVFWELPSVADHVAFSTGNGRCVSSDILRKGRVDEVPISLISTAWGGRLLGWTEDIDGVRVYTPPSLPPAGEQAARNIETGRSIAETKRPRVRDLMKKAAAALRSGQIN